MYQEVCFKPRPDARGGVIVGHSLSPPPPPLSHFVLATGLKEDYFVLREHLVHNGECSMSILYKVLMVLG